MVADEQADDSEAGPISSGQRFCMIYSSMGEKLLAILRGMASTMELSPPDMPSIEPMDHIERLNRAWQRTGQAIQHSIDKYAGETILLTPTNSPHSHDHE